jgi:DNA-directed RNA polymerase specialized sigma24 family protein
LSRKRRLRQVERQYGDKLDEVADFLAEFAAQVKAVGPKTYLESMAYNERDAKQDRQKVLDELPPDRRS